MMTRMMFLVGAVFALNLSSVALADDTKPATPPAQTEPAKKECDKKHKCDKNCKGDCMKEHKANEAEKTAGGEKK